MGLISWIIFGLIAGAIAKLIMPGKDPGGFVVTVLIGIAGALIGGFVGRAFWSARRYYTFFGVQGIGYFPF